MKVFVSNVDSPLGHNLVRLFSNTVTGSRREDEPEEEAEEENDDKPKEEKPKEFYTVVGNMTARLPGTDNGFESRQPVPVVETGDKKKDAAQKEAIEKFAMLGRAPKWVAGTVPVRRSRGFLIGCFPFMSYHELNSFDW